MHFIGFTSAVGGQQTCGKQGCNFESNSTQDTCERIGQKLQGKKFQQNYLVF